MNVGDNPVTVALKALKAGTGTFEAVKNAMAGFEFQPLPTYPCTLAGLFEQEEYVVVPDSFRDTVFVAMFEGAITREQFDELRELAKYRPSS